MTWIRCLLVVVVLVAASTTQLAHAQYMYLDSNGNGIHDPGDILNENGTATTVDVYLITNQNADSSAAYCASDSAGSLDVFAYSINLLASNGAASFSGFSNQASGFTTAFGQFNPGDGRYKNGFATTDPAQTLPAGGPYRLASLTITGTSGTPQVDIVAILTGVGDPTFFGTHCLGIDLTGVYTMETDWNSVAGLGPAAGGDVAPTVSAPTQLVLEKSTPVEFAAECADVDTADSVLVQVRGLPPGLQAVEGLSAGRKKQVRVYGALGASVPDDAKYMVEWTITDGATTRRASTEVRAAKARERTSADEARVIELVTGKYEHGLGEITGRSLGMGALPQLARMLRDERYRPSWHQIATTIGVLGDTAYFDTLSHFVWSRFRGEIDQRTFAAIQAAQASMAMTATLSPRALDYLIATATPGAWSAVPWHFPGESREKVLDLMHQWTLTALCYTDNPRADGVIMSIPMPPDRPGKVYPSDPPEVIRNRMEAIRVRGLRETHTRVRTHGLTAVWTDKMLWLRGAVR